jgi:hypothetical protein
VVGRVTNIGMPFFIAVEGESREVEGGWESGEFNASVSPPEGR